MTVFGLYGLRECVRERERERKREGESEREGERERNKKREKERASEKAIERESERERVITLYSLVDHPMTDNNTAIIRGGCKQWVVPVIGHAPQSLFVVSGWTENKTEPVSVPTAEGRCAEPLQFPVDDIHLINSASISNTFPRILPQNPC